MSLAQMYLYAIGAASLSTAAIAWTIFLSLASARDITKVRMGAVLAIVPIIGFGAQLFWIALEAITHHGPIILTLIGLVITTLVVASYAYLLLAKVGYIRGEGNTWLRILAVVNVFPICYMAWAILALAAD